MVTTDVCIIDTDGIRWAVRCDCEAHPDRGHEARPLPGEGRRRRGARDREPTVVDAIAALARARAVVELDAQHRLVVLARRPLDDQTVELVRRHRLLLAWAVRGRDTGHEWLACDVCGEAQLAAPEKVARRCHMTPECAGRIQRPAARLLDPKVAEGWRHLTTSPSTSQEHLTTAQSDSGTTTTESGHTDGHRGGWGGQISAAPARSVSGAHGIYIPTRRLGGGHDD